MLVMLVATAITHFEEEVLAASTKQTRQADKAGRLARHSGWPALSCARYWHPCFVEVVVLQYNMF
jgi:hypothetical protein